MCLYDLNHAGWRMFLCIVSNIVGDLKSKGLEVMWLNDVKSLS